MFIHLKLLKSFKNDRILENCNGMKKVLFPIRIFCYV